MRSVSRWLLVLLAGISVVALGYYAYILETGTLSMPFVGQERQSGQVMQFAVAKPRFLIDTYDGAVIDSGALAKSLMLNGVPFDPTVSAEGQLLVSGEYVRIGVNEAKKGFQLTLSADTYNDIRSTKFRLPRDIVLADTGFPRSVEIMETGLPRDKTYSVSMYGYPGLTPDDIRWYINTDPKTPCDMADTWNSLIYKRLKTARVTESQVSQIAKATYMLEYDTNTPRVCIIAGVGGDFQTVVDRRLSEFSATGSVIDMLSPEYDMQSQVEFRFTEDIYTDSGVLYSPEYMKNRSDAKIAFLKQLEISPEIPLTEANISLTPARASIIGNFQEGQKYTITLRDVPDIYGRKVTTKLDFTPIRKPFLSLGLENRRTMFRADEPINAKLYSLKTPKDTYSLKLCRISLEGYAKAERMIAEGKKEYTSALYDMLSSSGTTSSCTKRDIVIASGSMISPFDVRDFSPDKKLAPGLYILAFRNAEDVVGFEKFVAPRVFSIVDSHITMKIDASGKMEFLVTDITTGKPIPNQSVTLSRNISRTYTEQWNQDTQQYDVTYLPLSTASFAPGVSVGQTDGAGFLSAKKETLRENDYSSPYSLAFEYPGEEYEGGYHAFIATSTNNGHFGYVVSTWNDGITGWNFGLKDSDYSWETRPTYSAYIHTDRRLYLPGEKVYVHAILRKNDTTLSIPKDTNFVVKVTDPIGTEVKNITMRPNEYGTISFDFTLDPETSLGSYNINISPFDNGDQYWYIANGYTNFQVEVFKNPTFTADVTLKSPDIDNGVISNLRKKVNTDPNSPWYTDVYTTTLALEGLVKAHYYNGAEMRGVPFTYRIYRNEHYDDSYWGDCFWGCYWEPSPEFYTEGTGTIDSDGLGFFRIPVDFSSFYSDYMYTAEITITDPMTGEQVVTPGTLLAKMPANYKTFSYDNPLVFTPMKRIIKPGEKITGAVAPEHGAWDSSLSGKYTYSLIQKIYESIHVDDLRLSNTVIPVTREVVVTSGEVDGSGLTIDTRGMSPGEYHLKIAPKLEGGATPPDSSISDTLVYISGDFVNKDSQLRVIPEKTVYRSGEKARVLIITPFTGGYLYITRERGGVIDHEYVAVEGNTLLREYTIDDTMVPNIYIGAVAFAPGAPYGSRSYAVGYGEIVTDLSDKKAKIQITPNKDQYINREQVNVDLAFTDRFGNPLQGEVAVMVVDESLIRLLGNIDLDIIPKFFQKFPFTMKTSLSAIGMERNRFLSRKGSNGGSGDKGGGGVEIASRILFKNTAYYNPSVVTDATGRAKISFTLPDNVTDYRIMMIGQTKNSLFAVGEKTIAVRRDYTLESHVPYIAYPGDTTTVTATAFNSTKKVTSATVTLSIGTGANILKKEQEVILNSGESKGVEFTFAVPNTWRGATPYMLTLNEKGIILDSVTKTIEIPEIPLLEATYREFGVMTGSTLTLTLPKAENVDTDKSKVALRVASSLLVNADSAINSLIQYPYGCIEQTIASTLPNAFALKFQTLLGTAIDSKKAKENLDAGVKKILRMQHFSGGWKYWEQDDYANNHVTPYIVRSLFILRDLGVEVPDQALNNGINFILTLLDSDESVFGSDPDFRAEVFWTLTRAKSERAASVLKLIEPSKLSRHGYLAYAYGLHYLGNYSDTINAELSIRMRPKKDEDYWYWDSTADKAIYASLLLDRGQPDAATKILDALLRETDLSSYYISTQSKIQLLAALVKQATINAPKGTAQIALRADGLIADLSLSTTKLWQKVDTTRSKVGTTISLTREATNPTYYELLVRDIPSDILKTKPIARGNIQVSRLIEKIDESRGINTDGAFAAATPVTDGVFEKGQLYRVTLSVSLPDYTNKSWHHLTLEDFVPGGWRPIRGIFKTESAFTSDSQNGYYWNGWSHVEARDDRILATSEWGYGDKQTYTYYFRPEFVGTYLLPPVTAYFMYRPEVFALGAYQKVTVK